MNILLKRIAKKETYTIGKLYIDNVYFCDTIEDKDRGLNQNMSINDINKKKVYGETAIPTGTYSLIIPLVYLTYIPFFNSIYTPQIQYNCLFNFGML